ncbi:MAG: FAD-dependent oxidoreductase [Oricola sp.]|nr:FAD-dependent oxidoreductase [Oricola sp.]
MSGTVIIGAGLIGASTAYALARRAEKVTILDMQDAPGKGASEANGGMLTPSMADPWNSPGVWRDLIRYYGRADAPMVLKTKALPSLAVWGLKFLAAANDSQYWRATALNVRLGLFSLEVMEQWRRDADLSYDGATRGTAKIYRDKQAFRIGREKAERMQALGVVFEPLSPEALCERQPALAAIRDDLAGAVYFPKDESGDAYKFTNELLRSSYELGACAKWGASVKRLVKKNGRVSGVLLDSGEFIEAKRVVIAAGAHEPRLAFQAGVSLAIKPVKGYSMTFSAKGLDAAQRLRFPIIDDDLHAAVTPLGERIRVAGTAEFAGFDESLDDGRIETLRRMLRAILPEQADFLEAGELFRWSGLRPMHAYGAPWIGAAPVEGVYLNVGHGHLGWTLAAGSGEALAGEMQGEQAAFDLSDYKA